MRSVEAETLSSYSSTEALERPSVEKPDALTSLNKLYQRIPSPEKRSGISSELLNTAGHEFNHAVCAMHRGARVLKVSVIPYGNSLGRTEFSGLLLPDTVKVIAAAGSVATHDGCACGHGSDMHHVGLLTHLYGGISEEDAVGEAESVILQYSIGVRRRTAEMIAYKGEISEEDLLLCLQVAGIEESLANGTLDSKLYEDMIKVDDKPKTTEENTRQKTIIEYLPNGYQRVIYVVGGKTEIEELICNLCLAVNSHKKSCERYKKEENVIFSPN